MMNTIFPNPPLTAPNNVQSINSPPLTPLRPPVAPPWPPIGWNGRQREGWQPMRGREEPPALGGLWSQRGLWWELRSVWLNQLSWAGPADHRESVEWSHLGTILPPADLAGLGPRLGATTVTEVSPGSSSNIEIILSQRKLSVVCLTGEIWELRLIRMFAGGFLPLQAGHDRAEQDGRAPPWSAQAFPPQWEHGSQCSPAGPAHCSQTCISLPALALPLGWQNTARNASHVGLTTSVPGHQGPSPGPTVPSQTGESSTVLSAGFPWGI